MWIVLSVYIGGIMASIRSAIALSVTKEQLEGEILDAILWPFLLAAIVIQRAQNRKFEIAQRTKPSESEVVCPKVEVVSETGIVPTRGSNIGR